MKVTVWSRMAALAGRHEQTWTGDIDLGPLLLMSGGSDDPEAINEALFRFFNRVNGSDNTRLLSVGYTLPSLSVGDVITWNEQAWEVAGSGFKPLAVRL